LARRALADVVEDSSRYARDLAPHLRTSVGALRLKHVIDTRVDFFVLQKITAIHLLDAKLNLLPRPYG
jgi:hypothetical protein